MAVCALPFVFSWNEFIFVVVFGYRRAMTLPVVFSRYLVLGLTMGTIKE